MDPSSLTETNEEIRAFFTQWHSYKRAVEHNYLHHREAYAAVHEQLAAREEPFILLDLACGDSSNTIRALAGTRVAEYTGVDFSRPALGLAAETVAKLAYPARLVEENFVSFIEKTTEEWDVIFIGLSFHHLIGTEKAAFATTLRKRLRPGGRWTFFEPALPDGEDRRPYVERWGRHIRRHWTANTPEELETFYAHVSQYDHPETVERYEEIAREAGFRSVRALYRDPDLFYVVMSCE